MDGPPSWVEGMVAGRSRADREADQDMMIRGIAILAIFLFPALLGAKGLFALVGLQFDWWAVPVFAPLFVWVLVCMCTRHVWRPLELDVLRWRQRLKATVVLLVVVWLVWPLWAGPTAKAWHDAHAGFANFLHTGLTSFPLHVAWEASPLAMGLVAVLWVGIGMVIAPNLKRRERQSWPGPPADPEPLRTMLVAPPPPNHPRSMPSQRPNRPRSTPPRWP
jgi:hypothetical protein